MAKLTAWLVTIVGVLLLLQAAGILNTLTQFNDWIIAIAVLAIGLGKLARNYKLGGKKRK